MKKSILKFGLIAIILILLLSCGTFVQVKELPDATGKEIESIGIAMLNVKPAGSMRILMKNENTDEWNVIGGIDGLNNTVVIVNKAPEPLTNYSVQNRAFSKLVQTAWYNLLSGKIDYYLTALNGFSMHMLKNVSEEGDRIQGIKKVINIAESVGSGEDKNQIIELGKKYGVEMILAGNVQPIAEIFRVTGEVDKDDQFGGVENYTEDTYLLHLKPQYMMTLYNAKTGTVVKKIELADLKYNSEKLGNTDTVAIPVARGDRRSLINFLNSEKYSQLILQKLSEDTAQYAYLFLPYYHGYFK